MPRIPGVNDRPKASRSNSKAFGGFIIIGLIAAAGLAFWIFQRHHANSRSSSLAEDSPAMPAASQPLAQNSPRDPAGIATVDELSKPWSSKQFNFVDPHTHEAIPAMIVRLPGAAESFWAFSLHTPFSQCELRYATDLAAISQRYAYPATHPMIASDCDGTLYDPQKMATLADGTWVRGEIVRGGGIRPPIAIEVHIRGREIIADRIE
jgi:hypothetical protein